MTHFQEFSYSQKCPFFTFSLQACLIADVVQHFVDAKLEFDAGYIYEDVNRAIQHVHRSHSVHKGILSDPQKYLVKNVSELTSLLGRCIAVCSLLCCVRQ